MIAGHFGFAALVKSREPTSPLWGLMLATIWLDVVFAPLLILHVESLQTVHPGYGGLIIDADYTHSALGMAVLGAVLGLAFWPKWGKRVAVVIALVAMSHWALDLIVHRPDMAILPGNLGDFPKLGFGLWNDPRAAGFAELVLVVIGSLAYWRAAVRVSVADGRSTTWATACASLIAACGLVVLFLDYTS